jgi:5'-methylthioadenosine phosphorylase
MAKLKVGLILGSGFENAEFLNDFKESEIETPFGKPSSPVLTKKIKGIEVSVIFRHGKKHEIPPTFVNNKANIFALKYEGCKYILSTTDANSLKEEIKIGDFVILDDLIDLTKNRALTFFDKFEFGAMHTYMNNPFSELLRKKIIEVCREFGFRLHKTGTAITTEGSRYSTRAESKLFKQFADISTMTIAPECILANEAEVHYATIAVIGDYDAWKENYDLPVEEIKQIRKNSIDKIEKILFKIIDSFSREEELKRLKEKIRIIYDFPEPGETLYDISPLLFDKDSLKKLTEILCERYKDKKIDVIASTETKSFAVAGILAEKLNTGLMMIDKNIRKNLIPQNQKILLIDEMFSEESRKICTEIRSSHNEIIELCSLLEDKKPEDPPVYTFGLIKFEGE